MNKLVVIHKVRYGRETFCPDNDSAKKMLNLFKGTGRKGFSLDQLQIFRDTGHEVEIIPEQVPKLDDQINLGV